MGAELLESLILEANTNFVRVTGGGGGFIIGGFQSVNPPKPQS
jgi:hypothetical protein